MFRESRASKFFERPRGCLCNQSLPFFSLKNETKNQLRFSHGRVHGGEPGKNVSWRDGLKAQVFNYGKVFMHGARISFNSTKRPNLERNTRVPTSFSHPPVWYNAPCRECEIERERERERERENEWDREWESERERLVEWNMSSILSQPGFLCLLVIICDNDWLFDLLLWKHFATNCCNLRNMCLFHVLLLHFFALRQRMIIFLNNLLLLLCKKIAAGRRQPWFQIFIATTRDKVNKTELWPLRQRRADWIYLATKAYNSIVEFAN